MLIRIDSTTGVPLWQQIVAQVTKQIVGHSVALGDRLPTVRELAAELRLNPNTVARAYQELERDGIVETRRGLGTFACEVVDQHSGSERRQIIADRVDALLVEAAHLQIGLDELLEIVSARLEAMTPTAFSATSPSQHTPFEEHVA